MSRTNLEERLFNDSRLFVLARILRVSEYEALGLLSFMWHNTQNLRAVVASSRVIVASWRAVTASRGAKIVSALCESGWISEIGPDQFLIHGNKEKIEQIERNRANGKKGGQASAQANGRAIAGSDAQAGRSSEGVKPPLPLPLPLPLNTICSEVNESPSEPTEQKAPAVQTIPILGGVFDVTQADLDGWAEAYPAVNVPAELKRLREWNKAHPKRQKTRTGIRKHIVTWLAKAQDAGGSNASASRKPQYEPPGDGRIVPSVEETRRRIAEQEARLQANSIAARQEQENAR